MRTEPNRPLETQQQTSQHAEQRKPLPKAKPCDAPGDQPAKNAQQCPQKPIALPNCTVQGEPGDHANLKMPLDRPADSLAGRPDSEFEEVHFRATLFLGQQHCVSNGSCRGGPCRGTYEITHPEYAATGQPLKSDPWILTITIQNSGLAEAVRERFPESYGEHGELLAHGDETQLCPPLDVGENDEGILVDITGRLVEVQEREIMTTEPVVFDVSAICRIQ